jgi:hypothetical protein
MRPCSYKKTKSGFLKTFFKTQVRLLKPNYLSGKNKRSYEVGQKNKENAYSFWAATKISSLLWETVILCC